MKIVLSIDDSKYARWITEWVAQLPLASPPRVTALHVVDVASAKASFASHPVAVYNEKLVQTEIERLVAQSHRIRQDIKGLLTSLELKGKMVVEQGEVVPVILEHAGKRDALIVVGNRGLTGVDRVMLGSVSTKVVHQAPCSVLVVKQPARPIRRILLATDGSQPSQRAIHFLCKHVVPLKKRQGRPVEGVQVDVMNVMPYFRYPELKEAGTHIVQQATKKLQRVGFETAEVPRLGQPAEEPIE